MLSVLYWSTIWPTWWGGNTPANQSLGARITGALIGWRVPVYQCRPYCRQVLLYIQKRVFRSLKDYWVKAVIHRGKVRSKKVSKSGPQAFSMEITATAA